MMQQQSWGTSGWCDEDATTTATVRMDCETSFAGLSSEHLNVQEVIDFSDNPQSLDFHFLNFFWKLDFLWSWVWHVHLPPQPIMKILNLFPYLFSEFLFEFYCSDFPHAFWLKVHAFWFILSSFNVFTAQEIFKSTFIRTAQVRRWSDKNLTLLETSSGQKDSNVWFWKARVWFGSDDIFYLLNL